MHRIILFVIFSCIVSILCIQELVAQPEGRQRGQGPRAAERVVSELADAESGEQDAVTESNEHDAGEHDAGEQDVDKQDTGETPEPPPLVSPPPVPANSLVRITHPEVATRLGLDDNQRAEATRLVDLQILAISNAQMVGATEEQYLAIYKQYEERLANILTATQRSVLDKGLEEQTIRMVFAGQQWRDVLQLIAEQAGMQLVMDAPPPGTFNYADRESYTITQAQDIVNGNLITRGYTLTRRGRMLMLLNLNTPIENWAFPTVQPEELDGRASSEFVAVTHLL